MSRKRRKKIRYLGEAYRHLTARTGEQSSLTPLLWSRLHQREARAELLTLTPQRAAELYEDYRAGIMADVQRVWDELETYDEDLAVVVDKRQRALDSMPWQVEIDTTAVGDNPALTALAARQQELMQARLGAVENLAEAITYLGMADFHGVAALEITGNAQRMRWEIIEPWLLTRPTRRSPWYYNAEAERNATQVEELDTQAVIIREARPISLPAMFLIVAKQHAINEWDKFLDVFGNPSIFMELPPGTSDQTAQEMDALVQNVISDGRGTIPSGSKFTTIETGQNNSAAFQERARWCQQAIITLGTGGQLTVMSAPGSGTLAGNAHQDSFEGLMAGSAASISAAINRQYTRRVLAAEFPGQPALVRFSLAPEPADGRATMADLLGKITAAGYELATDAAASELVSLPLRRVSPAATPGMTPGGMGEPLANRCNQYHHDPGCPDASGADADPQTAKLPRPEDPAEPAGGWLDEPEDPHAENLPSPALQPPLPAPAGGQSPARAESKSAMRRVGEAALKWMSGISLPFRAARRAYEAKHGPLDNSATPSPAPLTQDELAAFAALATPNHARMEQRRAAVEASLRQAADLPAPSNPQQPAGEPASLHPANPPQKA